MSDLEGIDKEIERVEKQQFRLPHSSQNHEMLWFVRNLKAVIEELRELKWDGALNEAEEKIKKLEAEVEVLTKVNTGDFVLGIQQEATFQVKKWGDFHDNKKDEADWYWSCGFLIGKALFASLKGDFVKAKHHTISGAALLFQWHKSLTAKEGEK